MIGIDRVFLRKIVRLLVLLTSLVSIPTGTTWAQEEVTSPIYRYRERVATGYYEGYEVSPRRQRATIDLPTTRPGLFPFGLSSSLVRIRSRLPDSHRGLKFYERSTCIECHPREARNIHSTRAAITCRQCHGPEPIASINHWYSPLNPVRRGAYVCSKCHDGATASFATFHVHEPPAGSLETMESFPVLFFAYWGMLLLLVGTLAFFIPHTLMVGVREFSDIRAVVTIRGLIVRLLDPLKRPASWIGHRLKASLDSLRGLFKKKKTPKDEAKDVPKTIQ